MYLEKIEGKLPGHEVKIKYDCDGGFDECGRERMLKLRYAEKNFRDNEGKHICRKCFLKSKNPMKKKEIKEKAKKTCLKKYGTEMPMNKKELVEKRKAKFKDEDFKKQWVEKHRQTSLERYGVEHPMHLDETKERQRQTVQDKYGVDNPMQAEEIKKKARKTNLERYGVENAAQAPEVRVKMAQTTLQRYGVEHYNQLPEMKDYLRENCKEWLAESWANPWAKGIVRPEEWNQKQRETITELILQGKWNAGHKNTWRGNYDSIKCKKSNPMFRSGFELIYHWHLDHSELVEWYDYEPFCIPYKKDNGNIGLYFPDFLVKYQNNSVLSLCEIKADYLHDSLETQMKYDCAREYVKNNPNIEYNIFLKKDIHALGINLLDILGKKEVVVTHKPYE
jgi:hypothetical protein